MYEDTGLDVEVDSPIDALDAVVVDDGDSLGDATVANSGCGEECGNIPT